MRDTATAYFVLIAGYIFYIWKGTDWGRPSQPQVGEDGYQPPQGLDSVLPDKWERQYTTPNGEYVVWQYSTSYGLLYDTGLDERYYEDFIFIGNETHTGFITDSSDVGQMITPFGPAKSYPNIGVAVDEANRLASSPTGPVAPPSVTPPPSNEFFGGRNNAPQF